jgi:hypothetical protein
MARDIQATSNDDTGACVEDIAIRSVERREGEHQQIGWNGDSGEASGNPHLHFEVHPNDGPDASPRVVSRLIRSRPGEMAPSLRV